MDIPEYPVQSESLLISLILDKFAIETKMPIGLFPIGMTFTGTAPESGLFSVVSNDAMSDFCQVLRSFPEGKRSCDADHIRRAQLCKGYRNGQLRPCPRGLYNIHYPIYFDGEFVGALLAGQRKLRGSTELSTEELKSHLSQLELDASSISYLVDLYDKVPTVETSDFHGPVFDQIREISAAILEVVRTRLAFERRITNLLHEWLSLTQFMTVGAERLGDIFGESKQNPNPEQVNNISNEVRGYIKLLVAKAENLRHSMLFRKQMTYDFSPVKIVLFLNDLINLLKPIAAKKDVDLEHVYCLGGENITVEIAEEPMNRALLSLYDNAIKYSYEGIKERDLYRYIKTTAKFKPDFAILEISNYGIGVLPQEIDTVRKEGERGELSYDRNRTGSGLGLPQAIKVIEAHQGQLFIKSGPVDLKKKRGPYLTIITIRLPYSQRKQRQ